MSVPKEAAGKSLPPTPIKLTPGSDPHRMVVGLLNRGVSTRILAAVTGQSTHTIAAIRAHIRMGTYREE